MSTKTQVTYRFNSLDLDSHEFCMSMSVENWIPEKSVRVRLPAWIPGSYMIRDFARHLTRFRAYDGGREIGVRRVDKQTWAFVPSGVDWRVEYVVYAFDLSVRGAYLDRERAYFNGTCVFLSIDEHLDIAWRVEIPSTVAANDAAWRIHTSLPPQVVDPAGFGTYAGIGYQVLIDHPVEIGSAVIGSFDVAGRTHRIALSGAGRFDMERVVGDVQRVCAEHCAMFGDLPVMEYQFLCLATAEGYGGLEHASSASLMCRRADLPVPGVEKADKGYREFLGLCSHEYFHLWNVKRICPAALTTADLSAETYTELLWAFEGITSYYDDLALVRSGVVSRADYLGMLAGTVTRVLRAPGRLRQSVAESSFYAWTKFYKQDENAPNAIVSYYAKGGLIAFGLDVTLRLRSHDRVTLDDLMRLLWKEFGITGIGVPENGIEGAVARLLGEDLDDFFDRYVYGTDELPLDQWFAAVGVGMRTRAARNPEDLGGYQKALIEEMPCAGLGAKFDGSPAGLRLTTVLLGSPAAAAGLAPGDLLVALDGERVTTGNLADLMVRAMGESVRLHYFRRDRMCTGNLKVRQAPADTCELWLLDDHDMDGAVSARRRAWLASCVAAAPSV